MATEPTLGRRIMIEATICKDAPAGSAMVSKAWADLRALCARADAAERLAVAAELEVATRDALNAALERMYADPDKGRGMDTEEEAATYEAACNEHDNALAAWWALGEVDDA